MILIPIQDKEPGKDYVNSAFKSQSVSGSSKLSTNDSHEEGSDLNGDGST